jgi:hypothetical protein
MNAMTITPIAIHPIPTYDLDHAIRAALAGDTLALTRVIGETRPCLVHHAAQALGDLRDDADDVVQDLCVAILEGHVPGPKARHDALRHLVRMTRAHAEAHAREVGRFRDPR